MKLETRFAAIIALCFCLGVMVAGFLSYRLESRHAQAEIKQKADLVLETALAMRAFASEEIAPVLRTLNDTDHFHAIQVPSFSAQNAMRRLTLKLPEIGYRESAMNPTNLTDRATDWEVGLIREFEREPIRKEIVGETKYGNEAQYFVARPIRMSSAACLQCHSTPEAAPKSMLARYGSVNGFGWRIGDVVGMQLVTVPTAHAQANAMNSVLTTLGSFACIFVLSSAALLLLLRRHVAYPLERLTRLASDSSLGVLADDKDLAASSGQFADMHRAIVRLNISVAQSLKLLANQNQHDHSDDKRD
jgi:Protein of unknown function (DUF3365)